MLVATTASPDMQGQLRSRAHGDMILRSQGRSHARGLRRVGVRALQYPRISPLQAIRARLMRAVALMRLPRVVGAETGSPPSPPPPHAGSHLLTRPRTVGMTSLLPK